MRLTKMQDIAGVRLVVNDLKELTRVIKEIKGGKVLGKNITIINEFNYLKKSKEDGYRSYHIVFEIRNTYKGKEYKRLFELQVRTKAQHAWSTVVETIGTYRGEDFKGGGGNEDWKNFFKQSSYMFSLFEKFEASFGSVRKDEIERIIKSSISLKETMLNLKILEFLDFLNNITLDINQKINKDAANDYAIIVIDYINRESTVRTFPKNAVKTVDNLYINLEEELSCTNDIQVLMVKLTNLSDLRKAFPNFYIDVSDFVRILKSYFIKLTDYMDKFL